MGEVIWHHSGPQSAKSRKSSNRAVEQSRDEFCADYPGLFQQQTDFNSDDILLFRSDFVSALKHVPDQRFTIVLAVPKPLGKWDNHLSIAQFPFDFESGRSGALRGSTRPLSCTYLSAERFSAVLSNFFFPAFGRFFLLHAFQYLL